MRPVDRGVCPQADGADVVFGEYGHARPYLVDRLGDYCSFCEAPLLNPAVEHVRCKDKNPDLECAWSNFLLACPSCNSTKGTRIDTAADVASCLWPDQDRTLDAFVYRQDGTVSVAEGLVPDMRDRAHAIADLVGLLRRPGPNGGLTREQQLRGSDRRWVKRYEAWKEAADSRTDLLECRTPEMLRQVIRTAKGTGFFSVWFTVFQAEGDVLSELVRSFPGTASDRVSPRSGDAVASQTPNGAVRV